MRLLALSIVQLFCLSTGISVLAAITPEWHVDNSLWRWLISATGLILVVGGLTCREYIREITHRPTGNPGRTDH